MLISSLDKQINKFSLYKFKISHICFFCSVLKIRKYCIFSPVTCRGDKVRLINGILSKNCFYIYSDLGSDIFLQQLKMSYIYYPKQNKSISID